MFYLLQGEMDSDDSWSAVGRAGFILDNLIASGAAKLMIVVMPRGHTGPFSMGQDALPRADFVAEFQQDIDHAGFHTVPMTIFTCIAPRYRGVRQASREPNGLARI